MHTKEVAKHALIYGIGSIAQASIGFILLPILTKQFSQDDFGAYSLILMLSTVASAVFYLGVTSALPRSYFDYPEGNQRRSVYSTGLFLLLVGATLQITLGIWLSQDLALLLLNKRSTEYISAIKWALFSGALAFINQYFFTYLRMLRYSVVFVTFSLLSLVTSIGLTLWLLKMRQYGITAPFEAIAYSQIIIAVLFLLVYWKKTLTFYFSFLELRLMLYFGISTVFISIANMTIDWSDRVIIEHFLDLNSVGLYSAVIKIGSLVNVLLIIPLMQFWSPMMMEYRNHENIKILTSNILSYFFIVGGLIITFITLFAQDFLSFFVNYEINNTFFFILLITILSNVIYGSINIFAAGIFYERKIYLLVFVYYSIAILKLALNLLLIPKLGLIAAATSSLIASILLPLMTYALARQYFSFHIQWKRLFKLVFVISFPIGYMVIQIINNNLMTHWSLKLFIIILTVIWIVRWCFSDNERQHISSKLNNLLQ